MEIQMGGGGGSLNLEILKGRGGGCSSSFGNPGGREGVQKYAFHQGVCGFFLE